MGKHPDFRESYDLCVSRAVAHLRVLSEYCLPFVKIGGQFVALKGPDISLELEESLAAVKQLGAAVEEIKKVSIPNSDITHTLVIIQKKSPTPARYPRKPAIIAKTPIK